MIEDKIIFPVTITTLIIAIVVTVFGSILLWLTGLLVAVIFCAIGIGLLYAINKMVVEIDAKWFIMLPLFMFFVGLGLDKINVLNVQPLSVTGSFTPASICTYVLTIILFCLLVIVIMAGRE